MSKLEELTYKDHDGGKVSVVLPDAEDTLTVVSGRVALDPIQAREMATAMLAKLDELGV